MLEEARRLAALDPEDLGALRSLMAHQRRAGVSGGWLETASGWSIKRDAFSAVIDAQGLFSWRVGGLSSAPRKPLAEELNGEVVIDRFGGCPRLDGLRVEPQTIRLDLTDYYARFYEMGTHPPYPAPLVLDLRRRVAVVKAWRRDRVRLDSQRLEAYLTPGSLLEEADDLGLLLGFEGPLSYAPIVERVECYGFDSFSLGASEPLRPHNSYRGAPWRYRVIGSGRPLDSDQPFTLAPGERLEPIYDYAWVVVSQGAIDFLRVRDA